MPAQLTRVPFEPTEANIRTVAVQGGDYTTVQAAVTAASAAFVATGVYQTVYYYPGVDTTHTPATGVIVAPISEAPWESYTTNDYALMPGMYPAPEPMDIPDWDEPIPIVVRADDALAGLMTTDATFNDVQSYTANRHALGYAAFKGVPITIAPIGSKTTLAGVSGYMSIPQLLDAYTKFGHPLASHSWNHGDAPANAAEAYADVVKALDFTRNIPLAGVTGWDTVFSHLRTDGVGWIQPGTYSVSNPATINSAADASGLVGGLVRQHAPWSMAYYNIRPSQFVRHFSQSQWTAGPDHYHFPTDVTACPKEPYVILIHGVGAADNGYDMSFANFKALIDQIATWRDAGLCKPVGLNKLFAPKVANLRSDSYIYPADCSTIDTVDIKTPAAGTGRQIQATSTEGFTVDATADASSGPCIKGTQKQKMLYLVCPTPYVVPGRVHKFTFDAKADAANWGAFIAVQYYSRTGAQVKEVILGNTIIGTGSWVTGSWQFGVPKDCSYIRIKMYVDYSADLDYYLDNFKLEVIS